MKRLISIAALATLLTGCGDAYSTMACRQTVIDDLKTNEVKEVPGRYFRYIARTPDGAIWYVECLDASDTRITTKTPIFGPRP